MGPAAILSILVRANTGQANAALAKTQGQLGRTARSGDTAAKSLKGLAKGAAIGAAGVTAASVKMAVDFDKAMHNVNSIAGLPEQKFKDLEKSVLKLAGPTAQAPKVLAEGLYDVVSSGFKAKDAMVVLKAGAIAATAGLTDTATATKAVTAVLNAYHRPAKDAKAVSNDLFQTVNLGVLTFEELASSIGDVLPFASQMGIDLKAVGAATTTMTKAGISAPETMTRIKNVMVAMLKPSDALIQAYDKLGVASGTELIKKMGGGTVGFQHSIEAIVNTGLKAKDLEKAYKSLGVTSQKELVQKTGSVGKANAALASTLSANGAAVAKLFPNIRALGGALALTGINAKGAERDLKGFGNTAGATDKVFKEQSKSVAVQWQKLKALGSVVAIQFGTKILPAISKVMKMLADPKLTISEKLQKLGSMLGDAISKAVPKIADAMAKAAPKAVRAFFNAFTGSSLWGKLLISGVLLKKFGLLGRVLGLGAGKATATGMAAGVAGGAAATGAAATGLLAKVAPLARRAGMIGLGFMAVSGLSAAFGEKSAQASFSAKVGNFFQGALGLGVTDYTKKFNKAAQQILAGQEPPKSRPGGILGQVRNKSKDAGLSDDAKKQLDSLRSLRDRAARIFGHPVRLKVGIGGQAALNKALDKIEVNSKWMARNGGANFAIFRSVANRNMKLIARTIDIHSKAGKDAAARNFAGISENIKINLTNGTITARTALRALRHSLVSNSKGGADVFATNLKKARAALDALRAAGKISKTQYDRERRALGLLADQQGLTAKGSRRIQNAMKNEARLLKIATGDLGANARAHKRVSSVLGRVAAMTALVTGNTGSLAKVMEDLGGKLPTAKLQGVLTALNSIQTVAAALASVTTKKHRKGGVVHLAKGGMVPVALSSGELVKMPNGKGVTVPGKRVAADNVFTSLPAGSKVFTDHGQDLLAAGVPERKVLATQRPHFASGGTVAGAKRGIDYTVTLSNKVLSEARRKEAAAAGPSGPARGPKGTSPWPGLSEGIATWIAGALGHAIGKGVSVAPTSGYRSPAHNAAVGGAANSQHMLTQYPGGAVDFGGFHTGLAMKMAVVNATKDYKYPLLAPIGFVDDGHASGTGHAKGGLVGMAGGGKVRRYPGKGFNWAYKNYPRHGGGGASLSERQVRMVAEMAGFSPGRALQMAQIAHGESTYQPGVDGGLAGTRGPAGYGLWQITPGAWGGNGTEAIYRKYNSLGGRTGMFTPINNAKQAKFMYGQSGFGPWVGTQYLNRGMDISHVSSALPSNARSGTGGTTAPSPAQHRKSKKALKRMQRYIKGIGLSKGTERKLKGLTENAALYGDFAERASQLTGEGAEAHVYEETQAQWLARQLEVLFRLRNLLIKAETTVTRKRGTVAGMLYKYGTKGKIDHALKKLRKHPKRNRKLIGFLTALRANFPKGIAALKKQQSGLSTRRGELLTDLETVQGAGSPHNVMKKLPAVGALGGSIFETQMALKALGEKTSATDSSTTTDDSGRTDMLMELLRQANLRTEVSQRQYKVLQDLPFAGSYAQGGIVPGPIGRPMSAVVHGGEAIGQPGGVNVHLHFKPGTEWLKDFVKVEIKQETRKQARQGARGLPGGRR